MTNDFNAKLLAMLVAMMMLPAPAIAQFREGAPATLPAPRPAADPVVAILGDFRAAYAAARSPRLAVLWNRELDDEVASAYQDKRREREVETTDGNGLEEATQGPSGEMKRSENKQVRERLLETIGGTERVRTAVRVRLGNEPIDWQIEQAFNQTLQQGGARLVDRKLAMRLTGAAMGAGERANVQEIEMRALTGAADLLIELLQTADPRAPTGVTFRITVRDLRSARQIASVMASGRPPAQRPGYVAGPDGFVRGTVPEPGPSDIGRQLALTLMSALSANLN